MLEEMKEMIAEQLNCEESSITETTSFKDDLGADSLDLFELVMALEEKYEVEIPSEELAELTTVGAVMESQKNNGGEAYSTPFLKAGKETEADEDESNRTFTD